MRQAATYRSFMFPTQQGSYRLFRARGIDVWVHWSWLLVAFWVLSNRQGIYDSSIWNVIEYLTLFAIVLLHEFGHALACRQVGGQANRIVLWPLGGVAYVAPPFRPGAQLWSIAAGPLVNVCLVPVLWLAPLFFSKLGVSHETDDFWRWLWMVERINWTLLVFNLLPIYPLDGGQIVRSLLWFGVGPRRSLRFASITGVIGAAVLVVVAIWLRSIFGGVIAIFLGVNSWKAWQASRTE
jgi:Zn-dependent protease